ncbi:hypothetical protein LTR86_001904 [Recurvomyces mirabilis]|nr:hypothetical protein LTR86_001904 [Recurvomyces mirabilis]
MGDSTSFKTIDHVTSYPIVSDSIDAVRANPYGKKALEIGDSAVQNVLNTAGPILRKPYSVAEPYVKKADELAVSGLQQVDERIPLLKEDTQTVIDTGKSYAFFPYAYANDVYSDEYRKVSRNRNGSENLVTLITAVISSCFRIMFEIFYAAKDWVLPKAKEIQKKSPDYLRQAQDTAQQYKQIGQEKVNEYTKVGQQKAEELKSQAQQTADSTSRQAQQTADQAQSKAQQTADQAKHQAHQTKEDAKAKTGSK